MCVSVHFIRLDLSAESVHCFVLPLRVLCRMLGINNVLYDAQCNILNCVVYGFRIFVQLFFWCNISSS